MKKLVLGIKVSCTVPLTFAFHFHLSPSSLLTTEPKNSKSQRSKRYKASIKMNQINYHYSEYLPVGMVTSPSGVSDCLLLQDNLYCLLNWSWKWNHLHFNKNKCVLLRFHLSPPQFLFGYYYVKNVLIQVLNCHHDLGILMMCDLKWNHHIKFITSRVYKILGFIRQSFSNRSPLSKRDYTFL